MVANDETPGRRGRDDVRRGRDDELDKACRAHLDFLRKRCPHLLPRGPLEPGQVSDPLPLDVGRAGEVLQVAVQQVTADALARESGDRRARRDLPRAVVWTQGADSLLVLLDTLRVSTGDGVVTVAVDVSCDELVKLTQERRTTVEVDLVVGTEKRPAGLLAAATTPRGPALVVSRWGDALVALAWQGLLDASAGIAAASGSDTDGAPLVPTTWTASANGLQIGPQARHPFDRHPVGASGR
ncbi:hypothetical protein GCM10027446_00010 [Angustibacter peucedani]